MLVAVFCFPVADYERTVELFKGIFLFFFFGVKDQTEVTSAFPWPRAGFNVSVCLSPSSASQSSL